MLTREEKARQLLHAMTAIDDRYIAEAAPENTEHSAASEETVKSETIVPMKHTDVEKMNMDAQKEAEAPAKADMPDEDRHSEPKVLYMKPQKRWKPMGIIAAAAVLVIGFGAYMKTEKASNSMAPVAFVTGGTDRTRAIDGEAESAAAGADQDSAGAAAMGRSSRMETGTDPGVAAAENEPEMAAEAAPYADQGTKEVDGRARMKSSVTETGAAPEAASADAPMSMQIANPWSEFNSLEEAEADAGVEITLPESYQGFDHRIYRAMHRQMIEVIYQDADGREGFRIRKSRDFGNISGDYTRYDQEKTLEIGDRFVVTRGNGDAISVARWGNLSLNLSYAICVAEDQHFTEDDIRSLVEDIDPDIRETGTTRRKSDVFQPDPDAETIDPAKQPLY